MVISWTLGGQMKRARTRSTAGPCIPSTTRTDPATQTTRTITTSDARAQSKRSPDTRNAHTDGAWGPNNDQPGKSGEGGPCGLRHVDPSADITRAGRERCGWCGGLRAVCGSSFRVNPPPLHACARKGGKGSEDVGACARYQGASIASSAVRASSVSLVEITQGV